MPALFAENLASDIPCPVCGNVSLIVKTNRHTQAQFLGCPNFPDCTHTQAIPEAWRMRQAGQTGLFDALEERTKEDGTIQDDQG
jgi:ssDNA-binding Zn-finger/Zn-ribbon topoisomerase 1